MILRTGLDLIEIDRLEKINPAIRRRFIQRVYTQREIADCRDSNASLSGRFAAKEATSKVLGTGIGKVAWQDIEIIRGPFGEPVLHLHGRAALVANALGLTTWSVSITHAREMAAAVVVAISGEVPDGQA
jgi:holo-[acyl-carrier protein] synthase